MNKVLTLKDEYSDKIVTVVLNKILYVEYDTSIVTISLIGNVDYILEYKSERNAKKVFDEINSKLKSADLKQKEN